MSTTENVADETGPVWARLDLDRQQRTGLPEVLFAEGKTEEQVIKLAEILVREKRRALATRVHQELGQRLTRAVPGSHYEPVARLWWFSSVEATGKSEHTSKARVAIVSAGTSDQSVAEEALHAAAWFGLAVESHFDVGVAGLERLLDRIERLRQMDAVIVVAGMDGALPTVVAGLIPAPVIAVPTSVGYGASFEGLAPLLTMLSGCAPGVAVVNIDNGFGAAAMVTKMLAVRR